MAIVATILTLCTFFASNIQTSISDSYSDTVQDISSCPIKTMYSGPKCEPRPQIVKLPLPIDFVEVAEVLPASIEIQRCSGSCQEEHDFHACIPSKKKMKNVDVVFRTYGNELQCSSIELEEHLECECGCDMTSISCTEVQVK